MVNEFLIQQVGEELALDQNIDIETDASSMGKILYKDKALEHNGDNISYVELYAEIPRIKFQFWGERFGLNGEQMLSATPDIVKSHLGTLINYVFGKNIRLENLQAVDLTDEGLHQEFREGIDKYIIQINLTAKQKANLIS